MARANPTFTRNSLTGDFRWVSLKMNYTPKH